ncbi:C39 family peptidase [Heyndrickxia sporothermodurans]
MTVPYFAQWESRGLVQDFITGKLNPSDDPLWHLSGATSREEYAQWSSHICGMACLKMILAQWRNQIIPTIELMKACREYGGYIVDDDQNIKGLYYRPFVSFVKEKFGLEAEVKEHTTVEDVSNFLKQGHVFIASVHPSIRTPEKMPPKKGGHLIYVFDRNDRSNELIFHNPSGNITSSQENVHLSKEVFSHFYAQRGILIKVSESIS